jgi:hypothetical protein
MADILLKNGRIRAFQYPPQILADFLPIWPKFNKFGNISADFGGSLAKISDQI